MKLESMREAKNRPLETPGRAPGSETQRSARTCRAAPAPSTKKPDSESAEDPARLALTRTTIPSCANSRPATKSAGRACQGEDQQSSRRRLGNRLEAPTQNPVPGKAVADPTAPTRCRGESDVSGARGGIRSKILRAPENIHHDGKFVSLDQRNVEVLQKDAHSAIAKGNPCRNTVGIEQIDRHRDL